MRRLFVLLLLVPVAGCDGSETMDAGADSGIPPADASGDAGEDAGPSGPIDIECVTPTFGEMLALDETESVDVTIQVTDPADVAAVRIAGSEVAMDASGMVTTSVAASFGIHTVEVEVEANDGSLTNQICTFLTAQDYVPGGDPLVNAVRVRLNSGAVSDGDGMATDLESLEDIALRTAQNGLVDRVVSVETPTGLSSIFPAYTVSGSYFLQQVEYTSSMVLGPETITVMGEPGLIRIGGSTSTIRLGVRFTGDDCGGIGKCGFDETGTVDLTASSLDATLRLSVGPTGDPVIEVVSAPAMMITSATSSFTSYFDPPSLQAVVDSYMLSSSAVTLRTDFTTRWAQSVGELIGTILTSPQSPFAPSTMVSDVDGTTLPIALSVESNGIEIVDGDLVVGISTTVQPPGMGGPTPPPSSLGAPLSSAMVAGLSITTEDVGAMISEGTFNQMLHGHWQAGGLGGIVAPDMIVAPSMIVAPDMIVAPSMIVAPDMIQLDSALPAVSDLNADGTMTLMIGGITATVSGGGSWSGGVPVRVAVTATATVSDGSGTRPTFTITELTALHVSIPPGLSGPDRENVRGWGAVLGHHLANLAANDGTPGLPIVGLGVPETTSVGAETVPTGVSAGTVMGIVAPSMSISGDHFEAVGDFGQL